MTDGQSKLFKLKEWFTLGETAKHLSLNFGEDVTEADVLTLAMSGRLVLSVAFQATKWGRCGRLIQTESADLSKVRLVGNHLVSSTYLNIEFQDGDGEMCALEFDDEVVSLLGVYDLPMIGGEINDVQAQYRKFTDTPCPYPSSKRTPFVQIDGGIFIELLASLDDDENHSGSTAQLKKLEASIASNGLNEVTARELLAKHKLDRDKFLERPRGSLGTYLYPASSFGGDSTFVVRKTSIAKLIQALDSDNGETTNEAASEKPLGTKEENQMLKIIIGMAIKGYGHNPEARKNTTSTEVVNDLAAIGISIDAGTVLKYLNKAKSTVLPTKLVKP